LVLLINLSECLCRLIDLFLGQFLVQHKQNLPGTFNAFRKGNGGTDVGDNLALLYTLAVQVHLR
tara:strand:- start:7393 stop:7584 length:192 start_codon:yes stop_codon:yes gene_type:complete